MIMNVSKGVQHALNLFKKKQRCFQVINNLSVAVKYLFVLMGREFGYLKKGIEYCHQLRRSLVIEEIKSTWQVKKLSTKIINIVNNNNIVNKFFFYKL